MTARLITTSLLGLLLPATLHAAANVAQAPQSIRQTYADGSATELACDKRSRPPSCTLTIFVGTDARSYPIEFGKNDFQVHLGEYWFWPGVSQDKFTIAVPVSCSGQDLVRLRRSHRDYAECRVLLDAKGKGLVPLRVQITSVGAPHVQAERVLAGP